MYTVCAGCHQQCIHVVVSVKRPWHSTQQIIPYPYTQPQQQIPDADIWRWKIHSRHVFCTHNTFFHINAKKKATTTHDEEIFFSTRRRIVLPKSTVKISERGWLCAAAAATATWLLASHSTQSVGYRVREVNQPLSMNNVVFFTYISIDLFLSVKKCNLEERFQFNSVWFLQNAF